MGIIKFLLQVFTAKKAMAHETDAGVTNKQVEQFTLGFVKSFGGGVVGLVVGSIAGGMDGALAGGAIGCCVVLLIALFTSKEG